MFQDTTKYVKECPQCQIMKGDYTEPNTILGVIIANNPMDLGCIDFTKVDPSKDGKENILVLTDAFTKFSQAFVTPKIMSHLYAMYGVEQSMTTPTIHMEMLPWKD